MLKINLENGTCCHGMGVIELFPKVCSDLGGDDNTFEGAPVTTRRSDTTVEMVHH